MIFKKLDLSLFCNEGSSGSETCTNAANNTGSVQETPDKSESETDGTNSSLNDDIARRAEFDRLIKGEYKDLFDERIKAAIHRRFKSYKDEDDTSKLPYDWFDQAHRLKELYPDFSLKNAVTDKENGKKFMAMLAAGFDVRDAYESLHKNEIMDTMMRYVAQKIREKTINDIRTRGLRPYENGADSAAAHMVKSDPSTWSKEYMDNVVERVRRGERIVL